MRSRLLRGNHCRTRRCQSRSLATIPEGDVHATQPSARPRADAQAAILLRSGFRAQFRRSRLEAIRFTNS